MQGLHLWPSKVTDSEPHRRDSVQAIREANFMQILVPGIVSVATGEVVITGDGPTVHC